jgi:hypothetical protein
VKSVFISYSSSDAADVEGLADDIKSLGHQVWVDHELSGGQRWWDYILERIRECDAFVFAVTARSADSQACLRELSYAEALNKPIVPITIERDFTESLLPQSLSQLHRVNYTTQDKAAFASLNRALSTLPDAPPLPEQLPDVPPVPGTYLFDLKQEIDEPGVMSGTRQQELMAELRSRLAAGHRREDLLALARRFRQRDDLLKRTDEELAAFESQLVSKMETESAEETVRPAPEPRQPVTPAPAGSANSPGFGAADASRPPQDWTQERSREPAFSRTGAGEKPVAAWWWAIVIFFGWVGGVIAFLVHREASPRAAKNLLIGGIIAGIVWFLLYASS